MSTALTLSTKKLAYLKIPEHDQVDRDRDASKRLARRDVALRARRAIAIQ